MMNHRRQLACLGIAMGVALATGCANGGGGSFVRNPMRGSLKESLSRVEHRNEELQRELASAQDEVQRLATELEAAEIRNTDLATRLDNYRSLARGASDGAGYSDLPEDPGRGRTTRPAARQPYKAPFTQIPNRIEVPDPEPSSKSSSTTRPYLDTPQVEYFDFDAPAASRPSASRSRGTSESRVSSSSDMWNPVGSGNLSGRLR